MIFKWPYLQCVKFTKVLSNYIFEADNINVQGRWKYLKKISIEIKNIKYVNSSKKKQVIVEIKN